MAAAGADTPAVDMRQAAGTAVEPWLPVRGGRRADRHMFRARVVRPVFPRKVHPMLMPGLALDLEAWLRQKVISEGGIIPGLNRLQRKGGEPRRLGLRPYGLSAR
jgi:hypothetical protein